MRGSCSQSAAEADLSRCAEPVSEVERPQAAGGGVGEVREAPVRAAERLAGGALVRSLDPERAAREGLAGQLERAVAAAALGLLEQRDVDLGREHLVRAAHVAAAADRIVVG